MAKVTKVKMMIGKTINLGNYESIRVDYGVEADVGEAEDLDQIHDQLVDELDVGIARTTTAARNIR